MGENVRPVVLGEGIYTSKRNFNMTQHFKIKAAPNLY